MANGYRPNNPARRIMMLLNRTGAAWCEHARYVRRDRSVTPELPGVNSGHKPHNAQQPGSNPGHQFLNLNLATMRVVEFARSGLAEARRTKTPRIQGLIAATDLARVTTRSKWDRHQWPNAAAGEEPARQSLFSCE